MAEFDSTGFSAIDDFWGESSGPKSLVEQNRSGTGNPVRNGKRRGVGSKIPNATDGRDNLTKKLLNVGRKRGFLDDDDEEVCKQDTDEEEDAGRTGIASIEKSEKVKSDVPDLPQRKLGKKERKRLQQMEKEDHNDHADATNHHSSQNLSSKVADAMETGEIVPVKRKRRKVRSRQKNIRKDNREIKPAHLVVGQRHYQGRPLTAETRSKLNLPPPKLRTHFSQRGPLEDNAAVEGLAIDEFLTEDTGQATQAAPTERAKKSSKKKSKYKNLK